MLMFSSSIFGLHLVANFAVNAAAILIEIPLTVVSAVDFSRARPTGPTPCYPTRGTAATDVVLQVSLAFRSFRILCPAIFTVLRHYFYTTPRQLAESGTQDQHQGVDESVPLLQDHVAIQEYSQAPVEASSPIQRAIVGPFAAFISEPQEGWQYVSYFRKLVKHMRLFESREQSMKVGVYVASLVVQRLINVLVPIITKEIYRSIATHRGRAAAGYLAALIGIMWLQDAMTPLQSLLWDPIRNKTSRNVLVAGLNHFLQLSLDFHSSERSGEIISAHNKARSIGWLLGEVTVDVGANVADLLVASAYFLIQFNACYAIIMVAVCFFYTKLTIMITKLRAPIYKRRNEIYRNTNALKQDILARYKTLKIFLGDARELKRYAEALDIINTHDVEIVRWSTALEIAQSSIFLGGLATLCGLTLYQIQNQTSTTKDVQLSNADLVAIISYTSALNRPVGLFAVMLQNVQISMLDLQRIGEIFSQQPTMIDGPDATPLKSCRGDIVFDNVHFSYDGHVPLLNGLSFQCKAGTTTALVGKSGRGKSTIFDLLARFYEIQSGSIQVDGTDIRSYQIESLRSHMAYVLQEPQFSNDTVRHQLQFGGPDTKIETIRSACQRVSIDDKIMSLPSEYDTVMGERGSKFSGGERQRLAIAQALLRKPSIMLLDEATSHLDSSTEAQVQESVRASDKDRITILIAHRLATVTGVDQILVIDGGKIVQNGKHTDLLRQPGLYSTMWSEQGSVDLRT